MLDTAISGRIVSQKKRKRVHQYENHHIIDRQVIILHQNDSVHGIDQEKREE